MVVLTWIGQIVLFFIAWRVFYYGTAKANQLFNRESLYVDVAVNLVVAVVLLIVLGNLPSLWWSMPVVGAAIGVCSGQLGVFRRARVETSEGRR